MSELDAILDRLRDYLPDECATLNHNDLPETKAELEQLITKARDEAVEAFADNFLRAVEARMSVSLAGNSHDEFRLKVAFKNVLDDERAKLKGIAPLSGEENES